MSKTKVRAAVLESVQTKIGELGSVPIAWPNKTIAPPNAGIWAEVHYVEGDDAAVGLGDQGANQIDGFAQINIFVPTNTGEGDILDAFLTLEQYYTPGRSFTRDGQSVIIKRAVRASGMSSERAGNTYYMQPLTIYFYAQYPRPALS